MPRADVAADGGRVRIGLKRGADAERAGQQQER